MLPVSRCGPDPAFMERAMGIEPIANLLSPVESVGLTLLEDLIWAQKGDFAPKLRPNLPIAQNFGAMIEAKKPLQLGRNWGPTQRI